MGTEARAAPDAPDGPPTARKDTGTPLSNVLSSSNASLATISFQPRSTPSLQARVAEAPVFVPRSAGAGPSSSLRVDAPQDKASSHAVPASAPPETPFVPYAPYDYGEPPRNERAVRHPLQYHLCAPPLPHVSSMHPTHLAALTFFMDPTLHEELHRKQEALYTTGAPPEPGATAPLPSALHVYHSLVPLERGDAPPPSALVDPRFAHGTQHGLTGATGDPSRVYGYRSYAYKATCALDGKCYVLRRLESVPHVQPSALASVERWRTLQHPSLVAVREAFTTHAFGDHSLVFVYDYHPLATTLYMEHMTVKPLQPDRRTGRLQPVSAHVPERVLWTYTCQLAGLLRQVHAAGLAAQCLEPSKVLRTAHHRLRLGGCAIFDVLQPPAQTPAEAQAQLAQRQCEDLRALGRLLLCTACNNVAAAHTEDASLAVLQTKYSADWHTFLTQLLQPDALASADAVLQALAPHLADALSASFHYADLLEAALMRELENGRLVRLLCKLNAIDERPEWERDTKWAESGERYVLRLFRDLVFHAVDEHGRPALDLSHTLVHLNKLDAGVDEKIMLTSRDELNCIVVSYAELKRQVEAVWAELRQAPRQP
ncbi:PAB-dependent poly(A)-specific ribonuclease subunit 3 [Malassezia nana]|uniref:PAN2-PAN3 deadenylation complex subunit PAN3 n=1 Tax=Malassezia nana TaxID=180528 RepID=A0AAF0EH14_9BASI|nr:PAB-dependent poly(A)-specific ribonuclease subunit 3 [Malassezia nana]